ncbi:hypothetical protein MTY59_49640 [Mycobacterium senriense]|uniref:Uncharacterized protein n=1 Tax=Mycobacterium senriense TaxID=2775496 RepID=A0ABN6INN7_9MYCO|nr:hypothetical protein MTY59_49640 [Mycobacterium senriense]
MREMVRPTSAADINSRESLPKPVSPAAPMTKLDLLLRLAGRIVKGCRLRGSVALISSATRRAVPAGDRFARVKAPRPIPEAEEGAAEARCGGV